MSLSEYSQPVNIRRSRMTRPVTIVFPLYQGVTHLDFTGPHQFFSRLPDSQVIVASVDAVDVTADGLRFTGLADLRTIESCTLLCVPGGAGCTDAMQDEPYVAAIRRLAATADFITSVCTGSLLLGAAGILDGRHAACHWAWRHLLTEFGAIPDSARVVKDGTIITGGGVTAGIDFALAVIAELAGPDVAQSIQLNFEYAPEPPFQAGRPELAPPKIVEALNRKLLPLMKERRTIVKKVATTLRSGGESC